MRSEKTTSGPVSFLNRPGMAFLTTLTLLVVLLAVMFSDSFVPDKVHFSNDGPLGMQVTDAMKLPGGFLGTWNALNYLGISGGTLPVGGNMGIHWMLGPLGYAKFAPPIVMLVLGLGAFAFFRALRFTPLVCVLGGLAAALNSEFLSTACWGVVAQPLSFGLAYLGLAAAVAGRRRFEWAGLAVAGMMVGLGVTDAADIGAIFSLFIAAFVLFQSIIEGQGSAIVRSVKGSLRVAVVAVFAGLVAAQSLIVLTGVAISGIQGMTQDEMSVEKRWSWATQWSLPKVESLGTIVPGLFGYRMVPPPTDGGNYWGLVGCDPEMDRLLAAGQAVPDPRICVRFRGSAEYAGVLVVLLAAWAFAQSLRGDKSVFGLASRKWIWFWSAVALVSLVMSWGRFAPFYKLFFSLPYFSTIRNPTKFSHVMNWALVVLFAYGANGLCRRYLVTDARESDAGPLETFKTWWGRVTGFDRKWVLGCGAALAVSALAWLIYAASRVNLESYLQRVLFDESMAQTLAAFSIRQAGVFLLLLAAAIVLTVLAMSGYFAGRKARVGGFLLVAFLVFDLFRSDAHYIFHWDYTEKYASNPVIEKLGTKPWDHRVAILPSGHPGQPLLDQMYRIEWAQHHFPYNNIQSLDIVQLPRMPEDMAAFEKSLAPMKHTPERAVARRWQLTNTRYLIGVPEMVEVLNSKCDPDGRSFGVSMLFNVVPKPGVDKATRFEEMTAVLTSNGPYALICFSNALPRACLFPQWTVATNDAQALQALGDPAFDPLKTVQVTGDVQAAPATNPATASGRAEILHHASGRITIKTSSPVPSVLLLNDRYDSSWQVRVDGRSTPLLRGNFIMRAAAVPAGDHTVEFLFRPPIKGLYIAIPAMIVGLLLGALLLFGPRRNTADDETSAATPV